MTDFFLENCLLLNKSDFIFSAFYFHLSLFLFFFQGEATIHYNKLQADPKQGKSLDIGIFSMRY